MRGFTGLMRASFNGHEAVVELLLKHQCVDVNLSSEVYHQTALHLACTKGHAGIVRRLLAHPSLTCHNVANSSGHSPLMVALRDKKVECVRELVAVEGVDLRLE